MTKDSAAQKHARTRPVKAVRIHRFGGLEVITCKEVLRPAPGKGQVTVRVKAAGVGPWDAWVRAGVHTRDVDYARTLGADQVVDVQGVRFEERVKDVDVVLDTIGGETLDRSFEVLKPDKMVLAVDR